MGTRLQSVLGGRCEVRCDNLTRQLYATDASIYRIEPQCVAFPRSIREASAAVQAAAEVGVPLTPRGAGSGLVGGAIGEGMVVDFARHNRQITKLDLERRTVRVGAGVVLDQLNDFLKPHGCCFGPDVATSSRATLGGMIANDSSGARAPLHGTTAQHVVSLDLVLADGRVVNTFGAAAALEAQRDLVRRRVWQCAREIQERMPPGLIKRWPGYGIARYLREPDNLNFILSGSEGTLAGIWSADLSLVPLPSAKGLAVIFFSSIAEALQASVGLHDLNPAAIEHVDRILLDQTRGQLEFQPARDLLELDARPCESILMVECQDPIGDALSEVAHRRLGQRTLVLRGEREMNLVWALRKAGLSLLTGCKGPAKPVTAIEDTAVLPEKLPAYVAGLKSILEGAGLRACYYGHAASGLLHVRPVLDLRDAGDVRRLRQVTAEVSALVRQFKGSFAAEHGVGIARTEFMREQVGDELLGVMRDIKAGFDPTNLFNPGKVIPDGRFRLDQDLRLGSGYELRLPFAPALAFAARDASFVRNLEQCNGCGGCLKQSPGMCPTFIATGDELMSTRGRANLIRSVLEGRGLDGADPLRSIELERALGNCLGCKACNVECPSNVNLTLLKAELQHAAQRRDGLPLRARLLSSVDLLGRLGCLMPAFANELLEAGWFRRWLVATLGITLRRPLPPFAANRFDRGFHRRPAKGTGPRGPVILWDDTFVRYYEPHIGVAAVAVLEAAGYEVTLLRGRACCGRPAFSQGNLDEASSLGRHNLEQLARTNAPIVFLEPSCYSMFAEDYRELGLAGAEGVADRCHLFERFVGDLLAREPGALEFKAAEAPVAIHAHCHLKALMQPTFLSRLAMCLPAAQVALLHTGCCGMAGAFGATESKYDLSVQVAEPLVAQIRAQPAGTVTVASGTSCRQQIAHLAGGQSLHMAEWLARHLTRGVSPHFL